MTNGVVFTTMLLEVCMEDKRIRITFDTDINLRAEIKSRAARRNISLKTWIERAILEQVKREDKYDSKCDKSEQ